MSDNYQSIFDFSDPGESAGYLLWQVSMLWQRKMKAGLDPLALTPTQFACLAALKWLSTQQESVSQADIAAHVKIDRMMTSKIMKKLLSKHLIHKTDSQEDTRVKLISISVEGEELLRQALQAVKEVDQAFFSALDKSEVAFKEMMMQLMSRNYY